VAAPVLFLDDTVMLCDIELPVPDRHPVQLVKRNANVLEASEQFVFQIPLEIRRY
jgi:hypothetical protein